LTGKYEGTAKGPNGDVQMTMDFSDDAGKFSGTITTARGTYKITKGQMADGLLSRPRRNEWRDWPGGDSGRWKAGRRL
jgi:hypothetical protein